MPLLKVYLKQRDDFDKASLACSLRLVLQKILGVPAEDGPVMFCALSAENWHMPPGWPEDKVLVEVIMYPGRRPETKERLLIELTHELSHHLSIPLANVLITLHEPPLDNWGHRGQQVSKRGPSFRLDV